MLFCIFFAPTAFYVGLAIFKKQRPFRLHLKR